MTSAIERLPVELVDMVVVYMSLPECQALRLVSKQLYSLTLATFSTNYFSRRVTTLGAPSLNKLLKASAHPRFSSSVTLLDIKLLNYEDYGNLRKIDRVGIYPPPKRLPKVPQIKTEDISQESRLLDYMRTHRDPKAVIHPLSRALKRFPSLQTVRLRVNGLTLYGNPYINADAEVYQTFVSACFKAVLDAIIRSGIKLREFTLLKGASVRPVSKSANLIYPALNFPFPYLLSLRSAFSSLKSLRLSIRTNYNGNARVPGWENGVSQFISSAPTLEDLTLCLQARDSEPWLRAAIMHSVARSVDLPELRSLQLYGCVLDELDIITLIKTHALTLRRVLISDTDLRTGTWASVLVSFRQALDLGYLRLQYLQQTARPQDFQWDGDDSRNKNKLTIDTAKAMVVEDSASGLRGEAAEVACSTNADVVLEAAARVDVNRVVPPTEAKVAIEVD
ncbi:Protein-lysine N-methyltransferase efm4 [Kalmusia sp. IMI 367209]|nr:Protein-lysine N-methyltransferase efm4 [Kalmusia sp. IMI 367209]